MFLRHISEQFENVNITRRRDKEAWRTGRADFSCTAVVSLGEDLIVVFVDTDPMFVWQKAGVRKPSYRFHDSLLKLTTT